VELLKTEIVRNALANPMAVRALQKTVPQLDKFLLSASRGWVNTGMLAVALVETTGARSAQPREIATLCMPVGNAIILVGSNWGKASDPAWVHNLRKNPQARVTFRGYRGPMMARELSGHSRQDMWERLIEYNPQYARYQEGTERRLPVLLLERVQAKS